MNFKKLISTSYLSKSEEKKTKLSQSYWERDKNKGQKCPFDPKSQLSP